MGRGVEQVPFRLGLSVVPHARGAPVRRTFQAIRQSGERGIVASLAEGNYRIGFAAARPFRGRFGYWTLARRARSPTIDTTAPSSPNPGELPLIDLLIRGTIPTMPDRPEATVPPILEADATERVRAIFDDIKATKSLTFVPRFWRVLATDPDHLDRVWTHLKATMHPTKPTQLTPLIREVIALAVSATNGCPYCVHSHTAAVRKLGLDAAGIGEVLGVVALFNATNALAHGYQIEPDVFAPRE